MNKSTLLIAVRALKFQRWTEEESLERNEKFLEKHLEQTERRGEKPYERVLLAQERRDKDIRAKLVGIDKAITEIEEELLK